MVKVFAQSLSIDGIAGSIEGPVKFGSIGAILNAAIPLVFGFAGLGLLLMLIMAGFDLLTSAGDEKKLESGKQRLTYAILGIIVIIIAYWLVQMAGIIFGIVEIQSVFK